MKLKIFFLLLGKKIIKFKLDSSPQNFRYDVLYPLYSGWYLTFCLHQINIYLGDFQLQFEITRWRYCAEVLKEIIKKMISQTLRCPQGCQKNLTSLNINWIIFNQNSITFKNLLKIKSTVLFPNFYSIWLNISNSGHQYLVMCYGFITPLGTCQ